jgi:hypothetical protein
MQALPVAGPIITHHRAAALDVLEPSPELSEEDRLAAIHETLQVPCLFPDICCLLAHVQVAFVAASPKDGMANRRHGLHPKGR